MDDQRKAEIAEDWRALGFFYTCDDAAKELLIVGSRIGLAGFSEILREYIDDSQNEMLSEHEHYGPYGDLKVMTWTDAGLDGESSHGTLQDLAKLAELIDDRIAVLRPGERVRIREEYSMTSKYALVLDLREDAFDPTSLDGNLVTTTSRVF